MGLKEDIVLNLKGYDIEYQGKKLYVVEQLDYKGDTYLCVLHLDELPETVINFLKKNSSTSYENVENDELFDKLFNILGEDAIIKELNKIQKEMK